MPLGGFHLTLVYFIRESVELWIVVELSLHELLCMVYHRRFAYPKAHIINNTVHSNAWQQSCLFNDHNITSHAIGDEHYVSNPLPVSAISRHIILASELAMLAQH